jgi:hypothetical protein
MNDLQATAANNSIVPASASASAVDINAPASLDKLQLLNCDNQFVPVSSIWSSGSQQRTIVIFVRHWLCTACQDYMRLCWSEFSKQTNASDLNVKLVVIGCGTIKLGKSIASDIGCLNDSRFALYVDEKRQVYKALGMHSRVVMDCSLLWRGIARALYQGMTKCWCFCSSGATDQQGATFVYDKQGNCLFKHIEERPGDHPNLKNVFIAAQIKSVQ